MDSAIEGTQFDPNRLRIFFVHGRAPKPEPDVYREQLWRCLLEGVRRTEPDIAQALSAHPQVFDLIYWADLFYSDTREIEQDMSGIERVLRIEAPTPEDVAEAHRFGRQFKLRCYQFIDRFPKLMQRFAGDWMENTVEDTRRYLHNTDGLANEARRRVHDALNPAVAEHADIILIGHSLGSVIAYDTLWESSHERGGTPVPVSLFLTLGSPLGTRFIQRHLKGWYKSGRARYPHGIKIWRNLAVVGDVSALDSRIEDDFAELLRLDLVERLSDNKRTLYNSFRNDAGYNLHRSYGYLVTQASGRAICNAIKGDQLQNETGAIVNRIN